MKIILFSSFEKIFEHEDVIKFLFKFPPFALLSNYIRN